MASGRPFELGPFEIDEEVPAPFLLNCWKHHAGTILRRIDAAVSGGEAAVRELPRRLRLVGHELMDLYLGSLSPQDLAAELREILIDKGVFEPRALLAWLEPLRGYATLALSDGSVWVLRSSPVAGRHVHVHPGRRSPRTVRVRANLLKSAIAVIAWARLRGLALTGIEAINEARRELLVLSPVKSVAEDRGLGELLVRLREVTT